jgi:hypothetical protein
MLSKLFGKKQETTAPRGRACIQCGEVLPKHVKWCPVAAEAQAKERQSA